MSTPSTEFWGGSGVKGAIRPLGVVSFHDFVIRYINVPVNLQWSRDDWTAMQRAVEEAEAAITADKNPATVEARARAKEAYNTAKDGPYVCACSFKPGTVQRNDANADRLLMASFDIDDSALAREFTESPEALSEALYPYQFCAYTTASSTPENPRLRVMVPVKPCSPEFHKQFVFYIGHGLMGLPKAWKGQTESTTLSLPFYRPVKLAGEEFTSVVASRTTGDLIELIDLPPEVEDEVSRTYGYQSVIDESNDLDDLPIGSLTVEDIREPLFTIDAGCSRAEWCAIACALRHEFRDEEAAGAAYSLFVEWSETGGNFGSEEDCFIRWKSFRPEKKGRRPITLRTLLKAAVNAGWKPDKVSKKLELTVADRIAACEDPDTLRRDAPKWVAALPFGDSMSDEVFADLIQKAFTKYSGGKVSLAAVKKEIGKARREVKAEAATGNIPGWLRPWCLVTGQNKFYNTVTGSLLTPDGFDNANMHHMPKAEDNPERAAMTPRGYAVAHEGLIVKADALVYDPRHGGEKQFFQLPGDERVFVNEYRTSSLPKLDPVNSKRAIGYVFKHLLKQMSREDALHVMDWIAYSVQFPGKRIRHAIFIQGAQGCGKSIISAIIAAAIGEANATVVGPKEISSDFSGWATGGQLTTIEEIWVQGKGRAAVMNCLKPLITNNRVTITRKGVDPVTMDNVTNYIAYSNHRNALYLEPDDRRWFVIMSFIQTAAQKQALADTMIGKRRYFDFYGYLVKELAGALRHGFLNYAIRGSFDPDGDAPKTVFQEQVIADCKNKMWREMEYIIADGDSPLIGRDILFMPAMEAALGDKMKGNYHPDHYAWAMGFQPWGERASLNGSGKGQIWVHNELYDPAAGDPKDILMARYEKIPDEII